MDKIKPHPLSSAFIKRFASGNGGIPPLQYEQNALHYWCWMNQSNGLLNNYIAYYPMICGPNPGTAQSIINMSYNLIAPDPFTATPSYNLTAINITGSMCTVNGYQGNGTNSYWNTSFTPSTYLMGMGCYINLYANNGTSEVTDMGCDNTGGTSIWYIESYASTSNQVAIYTSGLGNIQVTSSSTFVPASHSVHRTTLSSASAYRNGVSLGTNSTTYTDVAGIYNIVLGAFNSAGSISRYSPRRYGSFFISIPLTATQETIRFRIEQNFQKMLGRAVSF